LLPVCEFKEKNLSGDEKKYPHNNFYFSIIYKLTEFWGFDEKLNLLIFHLPVSGDTLY
jgi:hypothetical protein